MDTGQAMTIGARYIPWIHSPSIRTCQYSPGDIHLWSGFPKPHGTGPISGPGPRRNSGVFSCPHYPMASTHPTVNYRLRASRLGTASCTARNWIHRIRVLQHWINKFSTVRAPKRSTTSANLCFPAIIAIEIWTPDLYNRLRLHLYSARERKHGFHCPSKFLSLGDQRPSHFIGSCLRFTLWCYHGSTKTQPIDPEEDRQPVLNKGKVPQSVFLFLVCDAVSTKNIDHITLQAIYYDGAHASTSSPS
jgi:hypothetical protein